MDMEEIGYFLNMSNIEEQNDSSKNIFTIPNCFWKYYDLYRRKLITLSEFADMADLSISDILQYLSQI